MIRHSANAAGVLAALLAAACQPPAPTPLTPLPPADDNATSVVQPTRYQLALHLPADDNTYSGEVRISAEVRAETDEITLQSRQIRIVTATVYAGGVALKAKTTSRADDLILELPRPIRAGAVTIAIQFEAEVGDDEEGIFRKTRGEDVYTFTHTAPNGARTVFPCFDDPKYRTAWELELSIPDDHRAFSNQPVAESRPGEPGYTRVRFARSPPLPTYLVAFATGPLHVTESQGEQPALRVVVPRDLRGSIDPGAIPAARAAIAAGVRYLDRPTNLEKLDLVAVPGLTGAMENPGLFTFDPKVLVEAPRGERDRHYAHGVIAHEVAHLWFGDLVMLESWDDLWLNEGFATWMSRKLIEEFDPTTRGRMLTVTDKRSAMKRDRRGDAPPVRRHFSSSAEVRDGFDMTTYRKGGAVLDTLEGWIGEQRFQEVMRSYVAKNAGRGVTTADFAAAVTDTGIAGAGRAIASLIDRPDIGVVDVSLDCSGDAPAAHISARPMKPAVPQSGVAKRSGSAGEFTLPVCLRTPAGRSCALATEKRTRVPLLDRLCPGWVVPNAGDEGYYHYRLPAKQLAALADPAVPLSERELLGLIVGTEALIETGTLAAEQGLPLLARLAGRGEPLLRRQIAETLSDLARSVAVAENRDKFARYARPMFATAVKRLSFDRPADESEVDRQYRLIMLYAAAELGEDPAVRRRARAQFDRWLASADVPAIGPEIYAAGFVAASAGDRALFDAIEAGLAARSEHQVRSLLLVLLGSFTEPALVERAFSLSFTVSAAEALRLYEGFAGNYRAETTVARLTEANASAIRKRYRNRIPAVLYASGCSEKTARGAETGLHIPGFPTPTATARDIRRCARVRETQLESVTRYLTSM